MPRTSSSDKGYSPANVPRTDMITNKQFNHLRRAMPFKNFGWYQHSDPSCKLNRDRVCDDSGENDGDEDNNTGSGDSSDEDSDGDSDESSNEGSDSEERMDTAKDLQEMIATTRP
ncbi:uncharacterized protein C8Q71DRAFT_855107 [Rhodofomes roseus]|uniref:Uncharacterized protein n=1 Tax=Rhodofomes roseus TaxID=34475 RepID=A0ABQ8KNK7_9APHY|nr:uncharacterized protein C8Q71DRAFT_855107 [Rhodofomes roseus]KAH9839799.1 hypothetical protein C8Q71DRAFT_855107 [Rhodofomes roseus]